MGDRLDQSIAICKEAGALALSHFEALDTLTVERKGRHDLVSQADRDVETFIREALQKAFPDDGLIGEEHDPVQSQSGFTWIIDPIDGTANFLSGRPHWCVVLAGIENDETKIGVIYDPCHDDLYVATRNGGASLNGKPLENPPATSLADGATSIGHSRYSPQGSVGQLVDLITDGGGTITASGSGALSIAYVAAGRTIGHCEGYMNAWDCLAALLMVDEAGGKTEDLKPSDVLENGTRIVIGASGVCAQLVSIANQAFKQP